MALGSRASAIEVDPSQISFAAQLAGSDKILGAGPSTAPVINNAPSAGVSITNGMVAP